MGRDDTSRGKGADPRQVLPGLEGRRDSPQGLRGVAERPGNYDAEDENLGRTQYWLG